MKEGKSTAAHAQIWDQPVPLLFHICSEAEERQHLSRQPQFLLSSCQWNNFLIIKMSCQADWHFPPRRVQVSPFVQIWLKISHSVAG